MTSASVRVGAIAAAALLSATTLSGCAVFDLLTDSERSPAATPSQAPRETATDEPAAGEGIGFTTGADLDPSWQAQWGDPFIGSSDFAVYAPDDGNGAWSYQDKATGCVLGYWQGSIDGIDAAGGDRDTSDRLLAIQFDADVSEIAEYAGDEISFDSFSGPIAARSVAGADSETGLTYIIAARALTALNGGLVATLDCPAGVDVYTQWQALQAGPGAYTAVVGPLG